MYPDDPFGNKGAWEKTTEIGQNIVSRYKPDYLVVVSAHWQLLGPRLIEIATPKMPGSSKQNLVENSLVYDFYGFPDHMYKEQFKTMHSKYVSGHIQSVLEEEGFAVHTPDRGLDHGVWVPLKIAFPDKSKSSTHERNLDIPLIQVSLPGSDKDFQAQFKEGNALKKLRQNLIWDHENHRYLRGMIICSGMTVHNLRDLRYFFTNGGKPLPYATKFNELLRKTMREGPDLLTNLEKLKTEHRSLLYQAHPTLEHFAPLVVGSGLISSDAAEPIKELYNDENASMGWGIYQFGFDYI